MATSEQVQAKIETFAQLLAEEFGEIDEENALSWLDAIETRAVEIGDAVTSELLKKKSADDLSQRNRLVRSVASWAAVPRIVKVIPSCRPIR